MIFNLEDASPLLINTKYNLQFGIQTLGRVIFCRIHANPLLSRQWWCMKRLSCQRVHYMPSGVHIWNMFQWVFCDCLASTCTYYVLNSMKVKHTKSEQSFDGNMTVHFFISKNRGKHMSRKEVKLKSKKSSNLSGWTSECWCHLHNVRQAVRLIATKTDDSAPANIFRLKFRILRWLEQAFVCFLHPSVPIIVNLISFMEDFQQRSALSKPQNSLSSMNSFPVLLRGRGIVFSNYLAVKMPMSHSWTRQDKGCRGFCGLLTVQGTVTSLTDSPQKRRK